MDKDAKIKARAELLKKLNKDHGKGTIGVYSDMPRLDIETISSGSFGLDAALGVGGWARGRIVEIYGSEACLSADTVLSYEIRKPDGTKVNSKGGTISHLYERFHRLPFTGDGRGKNRAVPADHEFFLASVNEEDRIFGNKIIDVVDTGTKDCFRVTTASGETIEATEDHKFYTGTDFVELKELKVGDPVFVHNNTPFTTDFIQSSRVSRKDVYVKDHPVAGEKLVKDKKTGKEYLYKRLAKSRAVMEAHINGLSYEEYIGRLNDASLDGLIFLKREQHVHHINENCMDNSLSNLVIIDSSEHSRQHALERHNNLRFIAVEDSIVSIENVGPKATFDLKMNSPYNNFVADKFVVHNSGKTTLTLHAIAEAQKTGGMAAFIDAEHALDPDYAQNLGVNMDDLVLTQPDSGEQALDLAEELVSSNVFDIVVIDSVAALTPQAEIDGEMGDHNVGGQARLMSKALRKLAGPVHRSKTTLVFINQTRQKIGVMFGNPTITSGGRALPFYASQRVEISRIGNIKKGEEVPGCRTRCKVVKNKVAPPFRKCEFDIVFGKGINKTGEILDAATSLDLVDKSGAWYSYNGDKIGQGRDSALDWFVSNPVAFGEIETQVRAHYGF